MIHTLERIHAQICFSPVHGDVHTVLLACTRYVLFIIACVLVWDLHGRIQAERLLFSYRLVEQTTIIIIC